MSQFGIVSRLAILCHRLRNQRECPLCGTTASRFRRVRSGFKGEEIRPEAECPGCRCRERHRLIWLYVNNETDLMSDGGRVLHVAPSTQLAQQFRSHSGIEYTSIDREDRNIDAFADVTNLPFLDDAFDVVICSHVLEHVVEDVVAMREIQRVTDPNGEALVLAPVDYDRETTYEDPSVTTPEMRREEFGQHDHVRVYGCDISDRLARVGFSVRVRQYASEFSPATIAEKGLLSNDYIYSCRPTDDDTSSRTR